jgi:hypothetical protein
MIVNERFHEVLKFLITNKKVRNQQEFVEIIGSDKSTISLIKTGKSNFPVDLFGKIEKKFPYISIDWLKTGEGEMVKSTKSIENNDETISIPKFAWETIQELIKTNASQQQTIASQQRTISEASETNKKIVGQAVEVATSAAVG